jgi:hypothetical protein
MNGAARSGSNRPLQAGRLVHHPDASAAQDQFAEGRQQLAGKDNSMLTASRDSPQIRPFLACRALAEFQLARTRSRQSRNTFAAETLE